MRRTLSMIVIAFVFTSPTLGQDDAMRATAGDGLKVTLIAPGYEAAGDPQSLCSLIAELAVPDKSKMTIRDGAALGGGFSEGILDELSIAVPLADDVYALLTAENISPEAATFRLTLAQPKGKELLPAAVERIRAKLVEQPPLAPEQREKRRKELGKQVNALEDKLSLLRAIAMNNATIGPEILKERIKAAELEKQRLEMDLVALRVRGGAIATQIANIKKQAEAALADDGVLEQLRRAAELRKQQWERTAQLSKTGNVSQSEIDEAEQKWVDAKIRTQEREEVVRQRTQASLLERLNDELATAMINQAEMETRLTLIREQQPSIDLKAMNEQKLTHLSERYRTLFRDPGALPPLYHELMKSLNDLKQERLMVDVIDVKVTELTPPTAPATGASQGAGAS